MTHDTTETEKALRIRTRRTLANDGEITVARSVWCPRQAQECSPAKCVTCQHCDAVMRNGRASYVYCDSSKPAGDVPLPTRDLVGSSLAKRTPITAIMTSDIACVRPDVALDLVAALVLKLGVDGLPVVDSVGQPLGVVSKTDLVDVAYDRASEASDATLCASGLDDVAALRTPITVADVMMDVACVLPETASVADAASLIVDEPMERVLVTCSQGTLVGIVSTRDVVRWLVEQGE